MAAIAFRHPLAIRRISMLEIDAVVSAKLGETRGRGRSQPVVFNRQVAMYLASRVGRWSTTVIGRFYNHRDHSTVCHSIQKIEKLRLGDSAIAGLLSDLEQEIEEQHSRSQVQSNGMASLGPVISESQIELVARSAAEQFYRDFKQALKRSIIHLQQSGSATIQDPPPLRSADIQIPTQNRLPQTIPNE
ncbi:MAG TPA: helix-turn-helix domain-containing protein [Bryobacteraceae bacterium]|nr:helix-turn-helix domain-containing protein [Bryobacteraceae bacterium]